MNADAGIDPVVLLGDADRAIESAGTGAAADGQDIYYSSRASTLERLRAIGVEPGTFQMCVGIDQHLLEASADRDVFEKAGEDRQALLADRSGDNHAVRLDSAQLSRLKIGNDDDFHPDDLFGRILFGDARNDRSNFRADVDFKLQQLVRAFYPLSRLYLADAKFDLSEVIDGDAAIGSWRSGLRGALNRSRTCTC